MPSQEDVQAAALTQLEDECDGGGDDADACPRVKLSSAKSHWTATAAPSQHIAADSKPQSDGRGGITQELHDAFVLQQRADIGLVRHLQQHLRGRCSDDAGKQQQQQRRRRRQQQQQQRQQQRRRRQQRQQQRQQRQQQQQQYRCCITRLPSASTQQLLQHAQTT